MTHVGTEPHQRALGAHSLVTIVGFLVCVELASGILQGYYTPIFSDIADHLDISDADVNWFEAAQLIVSALAVPVLARLGDMVGAKYVLLLSTAITALGSWVLAFAPSFTTFLIGWALQGAYVIWLPMEVAIVYRRTAGSGRQNLLTRRAAGILVGALELAVIIGALTSGAIVESTSMTVVLMLPAIVVTVCFFLILFGIERDPGRSGGKFDLIGFLLITDVIGLVMAGLITIRLQGADSPLAWILIALGLASLAPFIIYESRHEEPIIDVRLFASRAAVAGAADGVPLRHVRAGRADPAVDVRPDRPGRRGVRPRRRRVLRVHADRRVRRVPGRRRLQPAADHPDLRTPRRADPVVAARRPRLRVVAAVPRQHRPRPW